MLVSGDTVLGSKKWYKSDSISHWQNKNTEFYKSDNAEETPILRRFFMPKKIDFLLTNGDNF